MSFTTGVSCVCILGLMTLSSCRQNPPAPEIVYNCAANASDIAALEKEIPVFESTSGVHIKLNPFSGQDKLYAMMVAGQAPDIFYTNNTMRDRLAAEGRLLDLRSVCTDDPFVGRLWPAVLATGKSVDGGWYSVGNWSFTLGVYYNRDMFEAAGISIPDTTWTWEEMLAIAKRLTKDVDGDGIPDTYGIFIGSHFVEACELMNGANTGSHQLTAAFGPKSVEAFAQYLSLMESMRMPDLRRIQAMGMQPSQLLESGRVAMLVEAVPHQMLIETLRMKWGVLPIPRIAGNPPRYFRSGSGGLSISATTRNPRAAWEALKWIVGTARIYQPNPVLRDVDFVGGWEQRYPQLVGCGFRDVWDLSLRYDGGDPRFFVRYSSWTSAAILEQLQPLLDRLWARNITLAEFTASIPAVNSRVLRDLQDLAGKEEIRPAFRKDIQDALKEFGHAASR
jgi:ABC-type glycerol-3-phosphate transport system substrate-binding protein